MEGNKKINELKVIDQITGNEDLIISYGDETYRSKIFNIANVNQYWYSGTGINSIQTISATSTGDYAVAEGYNTTSIGDYSHAEGIQTIASGNYSHAEGYRTTANGSQSHAEGAYANAYLLGMHSKKSGGVRNTGQYGNVTVVGVTTNSGATQLTLDGNSPTISNTLVIPNSVVWNFKIMCLGVIDSNISSYEATGIIKNFGGITSLVTSNINTSNDDNSIIGLTLAANNTDNTLQVLANGHSTNQMEWVAYIEWVEIALNLS